jgi:hypothetical protein
VAARVREIMTERSSWSGTAADLLHIGVDPAHSGADARWPKNLHALAGRLRRAQTFLRVIACSREGHAGSRIIRIRKGLDATGSTVSPAGSVDDDDDDELISPSDSRPPVWSVTVARLWIAREPYRIPDRRRRCCR